LQTFLPYPDYAESAKVLDMSRLGKQRVEVIQIFNVLHEIDGAHLKPHGRHPACLMWKGYEIQLAEYGLTICEEWIGRGYKDTCFDKISYHLEMASSGDSTMTPPPWFGNPDFHIAHQSNLLRKDPDYYRPFFGEEVPDDLPYIWPTHSGLM
jgi:hypothetical protein